MRQRKTDYGTIILHWLLVGATSVAFVSGLRIATEAPDRVWLNWLDAVLPQHRGGFTPIPGPTAAKSARG